VQETPLQGIQPNFMRRSTITAHIPDLFFWVMALRKIHDIGPVSRKNTGLQDRSNRLIEARYHLFHWIC